MTSSIPSGSIVVAIDGSEHSERALAWAVAQAGLERRPLTVAVVANPGTVYPTVWGEAGSWEPGDLVQHLRTSAESLTVAAAASARELDPGIEIHRFASLGDPREVLVKLSEDARLVVMGSRGRGTVRSMLLGSVSANVSKHASCPVVVCRPTGDRRLGGGVVVGADGTAESVPVVEFAFELASVREMPVTVLHCLWDAEAAVAGLRGLAEDGLDPTDVAEVKVLLAESVAGLREKYPDVEVRMVVEHGLVDETIAKRDADWDVIVVGRHPVHSLARMLSGSIATAVVERAHGTVVVVPEAVPAD